MFSLSVSAELLGMDYLCDFFVLLFLLCLLLEARDKEWVTLSLIALMLL